MPNNKPRYSLTVDGKQRTVEADKFNNNIDAFVSQMPDATVRMKDASGKEADVKLNDLSSAYDQGYDYVTTDKPIYVNTKAPASSSNNERQKAAQDRPTAPVQQHQSIPAGKPQAPATPQQQGKQEPGFFSRLWQSAKNALSSAGKTGPEGHAVAAGEAIGNKMQQGSAARQPAQQAAAHPQQHVQQPQKDAQQTPQTAPKQNIESGQVSPQDAWRNQPITVGYLTKGQHDTTQGAVYDQMYKEFEDYYNKLNVGEHRPSAIRYLTNRAWDYNIDEGEGGGVVITPKGNRTSGYIDSNVTYVRDANGNVRTENTLGNGRANNIVNNVLANFLTNKAQAAAEELVKKIPYGVNEEMALDALRDNYYQSGYQKELWAIASKSGVQYKDFINEFMKPVLNETIKRTHNGLELPVNSLFSDWDYAAEAGKEYDPNALNADERKLYDALMTDFDQRLSADRATARGKANELSGRETASNLAIGGREGHAMQLGVPMETLREYNAYADPSKAVNYVLDKLYSNGKGGQGGVPVKDNIDRQRIGNLLYRKIMDKLVQERIPKSKWGYVLKGFMDGDLGELFKNYTQTDFERHLDNLADTKYMQSLKGFSGMLATGGHEVTKFLSDAWEYYLGGKVGSAVTSALRKRAIQRFAGDLIERGIQRNVAEGIAARAFQRTTQNAGRKAVMGAVHGAGTMGTAQAISGALRQSISPAAGAKMDEILQRKANGEQIDKKQEAQEIAEANKEAHNLTSVLGAGAMGGLSGAVAGMSFGPGTYVGETVGKWASKYMGDLASAATGYMARLGTNAASATAIGQAEGAITGEKPEGSIGNQFAQNLVTFALLDAQGAAPRMLNGHPIKSYRAWKEYERSYGISTEDQQRMRDAGYGDLIDTIDGLVSERFRDRGSSTLPNSGWKPQEKSTRINEGMMKLLSDDTIPEELKRKYYSLVTGDDSKQLSPIVASEVTTDEDGNHYLVTYNKYGNVVSDRQYHSEKAAQDAQMEIGHEQDENLTDTLQQGVFAKDADALMEHAYQAAVDAFKNGDSSLGKGQQTLLYLYQNKERLAKALAAAGTGEPLSESDQRLVSLFNTVQKQLFEHDANSHDGNIYNIARAAEAANGLASHSLYVARKGHTEKEAKKLAEENGEEAVHVGGDVWRTASEDAAVKDYQQRLYDYMSGIEEGQGAEVKEQGRIEYKPGEGAAAQQPPTEPSASKETVDAQQPAERDGSAPYKGAAQNGSEPIQGQGPTLSPEALEKGQQPQGQGQQQPQGLAEGAGQEKTPLQQRMEAGYERGMGIESDETQLAQIQHDTDFANQRFNQAFGDGNLNAFRNGMIDAVKNGDEDAMRKLLDKYEGQLSDEQKEATYGLIEIGAVQNGIDDSITSQTMEYRDQRQQELADISDAQGNITRLTLDDGTTAYLKNGDITNEYGGVMVVDENGETKQIPVSSIKQAEEPVSAQQQLNDDTNAFAEDLKTGYQRLASGADMLPGQQADINISGKMFHVTVDRELEDGRYQLIMDDGSPIVLTSDEMQQAVAAARNESVTAELANQKQQRAAQETEARRTKGIAGYADGKPDLGASETDPTVAGEYLRQQQAEDGKDPLPGIESEIEAQKSAQQQAQQDLDRHEQWMEINGDLYSPEDKATKESIIEQRKKEIADAKQRIRKLGEVRNAYMSSEQRMKFRNDRMRKSEEARKTAFAEWQKAQDVDKSKPATVDGIDNKTLLDNYATQADAENYLQRRREEVIHAYRDGASNTISDVQRRLQDYTNGLEELTTDELKSLHSQLADAKEQERLAMEQVKQIKAQQQKLGTLYKERNKAELDKMEPADRRAALLKGARTPEELLRKAHEAYKGSDFESRLDDLEPETLEEYVSQNLGYGTLNWEGTGSGISKKKGLKQELGLTRGIGHGFDSNGINAYLAPTGQGMSVDLAAHKMWEETRGTQFDNYDDQDFKNAILDLLGSAQKATDIKYLMIRNRINEVEDYERHQEEQERWYKEQEEEALKKRQQDIDMYNDYLNAIAESRLLTPEHESYLNGLYADEIAEAEQEEADREAAWKAYEAEKEENQLKQNNDGRTATETNDSGSEVDRQSEPGADDAGNGKSEETLPGKAAHQSAAETEHHAQRQVSDRSAHTPAGDSDADGSVSLSAPKLKEIKKRASQFSAETEEESGAFGRLVPKMSDEELLTYMRLDGNGDPNEAYHPELYDEYDSRHNDEEVDAYNSYLQQLRDSGTTAEQAEDMLANVQLDYKRYGATDERSMLNGQQDALMDYISELNHQEEEKSPSEEQGEGQMEMHEVDTDKLFKDLKAGKTATLSDYYKDEGVHSIGATYTPEKVAAERQNVNTDPTEGQKEAGNYKKGHIKVDGYDITIENPKGSTRSGKDASGKAWSVPMHYDYGYIKGTEGVDGDHIDVYLSDEPTKGNVYVVDQVNQNDGSFDEHKVMYGFPSMEAAVEAYKGQYEDGWKVGTVTEVSREDFKKWVESSHRKTKPFADYKSMEAAALQQLTERDGNHDRNVAHEVNDVSAGKKLESANDVLAEAERRKRLTSEEGAKKTWESLVNPNKLINFANDEEAQAKWVNEHLSDIVDGYIATCKNGNTLDPDELRKAFTGIGYDGKNVPQFRASEKHVVDILYAKMLLKALASGKSSITLLTGVGGAGKSTATRQMDLSNRGVVYDSAFNSFSSLEKAIKKAKAAGIKDIQVVAVHNDALTAFNNTVNRGLSSGRFLSLSYFIDDAFPKNAGKIAALSEKYPDVDIVCYDNSHNDASNRENGGLVSIDAAKHWDYSVSNALINQLLDIIEDGINKGRFTKDQAASLGFGLQEVPRSHGAVADPSTIERIARIGRRIRQEVGGDIRPSTSGEQPLVRGDGLHQPGGPRPHTAGKGAEIKPHSAKQLDFFDLFGDETADKPYYPIENGRIQPSRGIAFPVGWSLPTKDGRNIKVTKVLPGENRREVSWADGEGKAHSEEMSTDALQHLADVAFGFADDNTNQNNYGKDNTENAEGAGADSGANRPLGSVRPSGDGVLGSSELGRPDAGEVGGDTKESSGLADGQPGGLSTVGRRGGAKVDADSGDTASSLVGGRRHGVSTGVRPDGEGHSDRGTDGRPGAPERPLRVSVRPGADASGSDSGESPERGASSEEGAGVRGLLAGQEKPGKPARDEATATMRADDGSKKTASERNTPLNTRNYLYPKDGADIDNMSAKDRLATNVDALETLAQLVHEGRTATAEERNKLGKFRGWGGVDMTDVWNVDSLLRKGRKWDSSRRENVTDVANPYYRLGMVIKSLDPDGKRGVFESIKKAALTSYYTPLPIAGAMNEYLSLAGYKGGGSMLDPSIGNGVFEGTMPKDMQQRTQIYGVELDWLTAQIAKNLYPDAHIQQSGYQEAELCKDAFDVVESNIPFGDIKVYDPTWRHDSSPAKKAAQGKIHTYFALKMMENAKPGGLVTIMTSNSIMDTPGNGIIRDALLEQGEFLGAVRLPDNTFKGAGTRVVTDVIFMRKYKDEDDRANTLARDGYAEKQRQFSRVDTIKAHNASEGKDYDVRISGYYKSNPKMMLGKVVAGGQYRGDEFGLTSVDDTNALAKKMHEAIKKEIVGDRAGQLYDTHKSERKIYHAIRESYVGDGSYQSSGNIVEQNGKFGVLRAVSHGDVDMGFDFEENPKLNRFAARIRLYIPVRTALKKLIAAQINRESEKVIEGYRKELNAAYKAFHNRYGLLNDKSNNFIAEDIDSYQMLSLEDIDEDTKKLKGLADIFTKNTIKPTIDTSKVNDPASAIATSLAQYGEVRPSFMETVLGKDWPTLCGDTLYKVPFSESYVVSDDYLSGDVKSKLEDAQRAAAESSEYKRNVEALEKVQPRDIPIGEINIRMGARWVPDKIYTDFMKKMFGIPDWDHVKSGVRYIPESDDYIINVDSSETGIEADKWATDRRSAKEIFEAAMKDRSLKVYDHHSDGSTSLNKSATELANSKVQDLRETFETWVTSDPERADALGKMYNEKFNRTVIRQWSAPFLQPVGLQGMTLRPHQQAAVWMLLNNRGGIVDHIVGAGKTLVMQSAIMEMRRMGIAKKPMIIALKATVGQIAKEFAQAYPAAKILAPTEKDFVAKNRKKLFAQIATNDYDCVIVSHDYYVKFGHTKEIESQTLREQLQQLEATIMLMRTNDVNGSQSQLTKRQLKGLEKRKANLEARMKRIMDRPTDKEFCFENLGVDYLFVDECQRFKSLPYATTYNQVAGLGDPTGSTKAVALLNGVRYLQQLHQGDRGTVFLSGTTITNSLVEVYNLLNYLRPNMMKKLGYTTFDAWAAQFAVRSSELEYGVTNELKEKNRFRYFQNVSELGKMYAEIADVRNDYNLKLPKPKPRTHLVTIEPSDDLDIINEQIVNMVKTKDGSFFGIDGNDKTPWSLQASNFSTKASVSPRLVDPSLPDDPHGKLATACENVAKIYKQFDAQKGTQLIFCDTGVPSKGKEYDAYTDIINRLVNDYGIPRKEIVDIHTANTDDKRKALFKKVRDGQVRILIGGTVNMGTGVNVQSRLVALHHIDIPWQPADTEQRNGRGVRQGNIIARDFNDNNVDIYYYAVKGTLDTYRYQLQDIKGKMFAQFKLNTIDSDSAREFDEGEIDADGQIDPAQMVAMLSGNPVIFEKSKQDKLVKKLRRQESSEYNDYLRRKRNIESLKSRKESFEEYKRMNDRDKEFLERNGYDPSRPANDYKIVDGSGKEFPWKKATEAGKIIHKLWKSAKPFTLKGYGMKAHVVQNGDDMFGFQTILKPVSDHWGLSNLPYSVPLSDTDQAAGQAFANLVKSIYHSGDAYKAELDKLTHKLEGSDKIGEFQFSKQKQLEEALAKKKELDAEYQKLSDETNNEAEQKTGEPQGSQDSGDDGALYRMADEEEAAKLDKEPTVKVYRAMQLINGKLYPPMAAKVNGSLVESAEPGQWLRADEHPELAKNGLFTLNKGGKDASGKRLGSVPAAYNPYWHTSRSPLNDQFSSAYKRPNLVTVEVEIPKSELTSGYQADGVKDPVGEMSWHAGPVSSKLPKEKERKVILSRWCKVVRVVPDAEVADKVAGMLKGEDISVPDNTVTPSLRMELEKRGVPITHTKMVEDWERKYPATQSGLSRDGDGAYTDDELSEMNDPFVKMLGEKARSAKQRKAFAARERRRMEAAAHEWADKLHLDNVEIVTEPVAIKDRRGRVYHPKGYFDKGTSRIVICIGNNRNVRDVVQTVLHEAVGHYGLRRLFGKHFDTFLENVYAAADMDVRRRITELALRKYGGNFHVATEEYLASLAEDTNYESLSKGFWPRIKQLFLRMLRAIGLKDFVDRGVTLSINELRYILWRSFKNLTAPGEHRSFADEAEDEAKQAELKVGDFRLDKAIDQGASPEELAVINKTVQRSWLAKKAMDTLRQLTAAKRELDEAITENPSSEKASRLRGQLEKLNETMDDNRDWAEDLNVDLRQLLKDNGVKEEDLREFDSRQEGIDGAQQRPTEQSLNEQQEAAEREAREEKVRRLTQRFVRTFRQWLKVKKEYDRSFQEDPESERTDTLGDVLNGWNDNMETLVDEAYEMGLDARQLRQKLKDNGTEDEDLREYDGLFADEEVPIAVDKNITPEQQALLRGLNSHEYPTIQKLSAEKLGNNVESAVNKGENVSEHGAAAQQPTERRGNVGADMNRRGMSTREFSDQEKIDMRNAAEELGETLGGVPVAIEHNGKDGVKGSFDTHDNTVHVNMDEADGIEDVEATVCHEVLGHEGLKALFGSNKGVDMFGQFIYDNASKELRRRIVEKADEEGYEWTDPLRFSKAAQEVFSDIASEGPRNAEEFSLWRKVKHYVIRALKSLGIRIRGIVNDHDLRYFVLKTGKAVKKWSMMDEEAQREAAEPGRIMYSRRGKPRKRKDESMAQYIERLRTYERWKQAEEKAKAANDPLPEKEDYDHQAQDEYNKAMDDWRKSNNIQSGDKEPSEFPKRKHGDSPQEYAVRVADYESQSDIWKTAPNVFDYMKKAQDEYHAAYEAWKTRYDLQEMENVDEKLYSGEPIPVDQPQTDEQHYDQLEVEHAVEQDAARELGDAVGMDLSAEGAQRHAKLAVIERRKNLESASADDAIFIHDLCRDIDALAKKKGMKTAELREKLIDVIESPVAQQDADKEVDKWVDVLNNMRAFQDAHSSITADGVKAAMPELTALSHLYVKYGVKPSTYEQRKEIHEAAKALADKFNDYYKDTTGYNQLFGDDIMQVGKYIVKMSDAAYAAAAASKLGEDPDVKAIVDRIHDWYDNFYHVIEDAGLRGDAGYVENGYINHIWDKKKSDAGAWEKYVENYQRTKSGNMRHRTISTYADGIEVGLVPKFNDVAQIMSYYSRQNNEAIANKKFLDDLSFLTVSELNKDGEVVRTLPVLNSHHPNRFDEERYKMYHVPGVGDVWVLNEVSRRFSSIFGTMRTQDIPDWLSKTGKVYDLLGSTMKKIQLSISGFHMGALSEVALAQMRPDRGMKAIFKYILLDSIRHHGEIPAYVHPEDFKLAASHLVQLGATQDYAASDVNMITERFRNYVRSLRKDEAFVKQAAGGALTPLAVALDFINKGMDKLLWNYLHDGLKIACFKQFAEQIDRRVEKEGLTSSQRDRLLDEAGQYVNDTFGGQYWELLNVSPAALKWMRRALLSPDWFISTQRHFFANFGFGSLYDTRSFGEYVKESLRLNRAAAQQRRTEPGSVESIDADGDIYRKFRSKEARLCYVLGVCVFFYTMMNGLNAVMRARDEAKEKEKADEMRKTNPDYKSPYELSYPDGMKWYDYTMLGNSLGQQTHLFLERYEDGTEMYVRWGKQFREFPEMFIGRKGLDFPAPMIQRMMGKANPVIGLVRDNLGALGIWGFENQNDIEEIQAKYGKQIGLLAMNARHFLPFSLPTQSEKEFKMMDLFMPSSKGFTRYKTVDYFKDFIKSGDMEGVARVYRAATMNGIDAEKCLQAAITTLKAEQRDEMSDGIKDLSQAVKRYDAAKTLKEKKVLKNKLTKLLAAESYKAFTRDEAMQMIEDYMNGDNVSEKDNDRYIELSNSSDIRADYRLSAIGKQAKKFVVQIKDAQSSGDASAAEKLANRYSSWIEINTIINQERSSVNKLKKQLGKGNDKAVMNEIREVRKQAQQLVDALPAPK